MFTLRLLSIVLLAGLVPTLVLGQPQDTTSGSPASAQVVERITDAFQQGSAERLLAPSTDRVEVSLFGARTYYSSAQAFYVLRDFFSNYAPRQFRVSDVTETATSCFISGRYEHTHSERALQVYVRLVQPERNDWRLHEVRIDHEAE